MARIFCIHEVLVKRNLHSTLEIHSWLALFLLEGWKQLEDYLMVTSSKWAKPDCLKEGRILFYVSLSQRELWEQMI